jgi:formylmethanofuran dehydrogenase subunit B
MSEESILPEIQIVEHATCLACGCLCDDIRVVVEGGRIVEAGRTCAIGRPWFLAPRPGEGHPAASIEGRPSGPAEAIERAAEILRAARAPVLWGLSGATIEAAASALAIADRIGAVVDLAGSAEGAARLAAFQRVGQVSASLGEVKDRADLVVFWGVDPLATHPRHWERYSVDPRGRFVPEGRAGRFVIVVDSEPSESSRSADLFVPLAPDRQVEALGMLRALVRGVALDPDRATRSTGLPFPTLETLADRFRAARYGAFFFGTKLERSEAGSRAFEAVLTLARDLNEGRRFVALEMGRPGNASGASSVLSWQAGAASAVDYGLGYPRHLPGEATLAGRLALGEVDAALIVADDPAVELPPETLRRLTTIPSVAIGPGATVRTATSTVAFDVARPGIEAGGTVARIDGVMLPLRPSIGSGLPTAIEILDALDRRIGEEKLSGG